MTTSLPMLAAGGGGGGGGRGTSGGMIIGPQSDHAAINKEDVRDIKHCGHHSLSSTEGNIFGM
jgi:hypothetical protein